MERETVQSSQIASVGYNSTTEVLEIEFCKQVDGGIGGRNVYQYFEVPPHVHHDLMHAESIGRYFGKEIRGKFKFEKLPPPEKAQGATP